MNTKIPPRNLLIGVWLALMLLMFVNFGLAHFDLGTIGTVIILTIAFIQMLLVLLFFMRLHESTKLICVFSLTGFLWLAILFTLTLADYLTRQWH